MAHAIALPYSIAPLRPDIYQARIDMAARETLGRARKSHQMGGFFDDLFGTVWNAVDGLVDALRDALTSLVNAISQIGETIALIVRAAIGDVDWSEVLDSLGKVFREVSNIVVAMNPLRLSYNFLMESPLTAHAFRELDKFTGGMITGVVNVSDVVWRGMRGDPISKAEILNDILTIIKVAVIVFSGPVGWGAWVGSLLGKQVCNKQTSGKEVCRAAFVILGSAFGQWADEVYAGLDAEFAEILEEVGLEYLETRGIDQISREAIRICQSNNWVGDKECQVIGEAAANYVKQLDEDKDWTEFLVSELARLGASELMAQWFPPETKQAQAIKWSIQYKDVLVPGQTVVQNKVGPGTLLLLAGGAMMLMIGGAS